MVHSYNSSVFISELGFSMTGSNHKAIEVLSVLELSFKLNSYWTKLQTCRKIHYFYGSILEIPL